MNYLVITAILFINLSANAKGPSIKGSNFSAPTINGKDSIFQPSAGEIVYDTLDQNFYGRTHLGEWKVLSNGGSETTMPVGSILTTASITCPSGFILADGSAISRLDYSTLFSEIGTTHGTGNNSTTFNIPDYRGRFLRGVDGTAGRDPNSSTRSAMNAGGNSANNVGSVQQDAFQGHAHSQVGTGNWNAPGAYDAGNVNGTPANMMNTGGPVNDGTNGTPRTASETRPTNAYVNYCIKF